MIDKRSMRSALESMQRAAEESLGQDFAFHEALQALKQEIDHDPRVLSRVGELEAAGGSVFKSFVPRIRIRVRTEEGVFALPKPAQIGLASAAEPIGRLTQELRSAASSVISNSRHYDELDAIVNEAVAASDRFEGIASEVESAGHEVLICLDLSAYAQARGKAGPARQIPEASLYAGNSVPMPLTGKDRSFLKGLKIKIDES